MSYIGQLFGYGKPAASSSTSSSTSSPPGPELTPGWEVYKNQRGEILYGNNLIPACQFNAPVAQAQTAPVAQAQQVPQTLQKRNFAPGFDQAKTTEEFLAKGPAYGHYNGGLKRKQSRRKQSRRKQSRRKQSRRKQSRRKQSRRKQSRRKRMQSRRRS